MADFSAACVQFTAGPEPEENLAKLRELIRQARAEGADFVATPETSDMMEPRRKLAYEKARPEAEHRVLAELRDLASELGLWLLVGSIVVRPEGEDERLANRSILIDPSGAIRARYDKIHMFDVSIPDGQSYRESKAYRPGDRTVLVDLPWGTLGLTICYDLRFPHLYRALAQAGADFLTAPSAFTRMTGEAHWHTLLRARAIENGAFVLAAAQCGDHEGGRQTFGHSLIVDPWGRVLADGGPAPGIVIARIDPAEVTKARASLSPLVDDKDLASPPSEPAYREAGE